MYFSNKIRSVDGNKWRVNSNTDYLAVLEAYLTFIGQMRIQEL